MEAIIAGTYSLKRFLQKLLEQRNTKKNEKRNGVITLPWRLRNLFSISLVMPTQLMLKVGRFQPQKIQSSHLKIRDVNQRLKRRHRAPAFQQFFTILARNLQGKQVVGKIIGIFFPFALKITRCTGHLRVPQILSLSLFAIHQGIYFYFFSFEFITRRTLEDEQRHYKTFPTIPVSQLTPL